MKTIVLAFRFIVGLVFILSGLIKMNDPLGFSYKLEEYFSPVVFNLEFLDPLALPLAILIVIFEVMLGISLILGYKPKWTIYSMTGLIIFFTFLTFYSAYFDKVKECGCFGDAIKLTPWESFTKDLVLLGFCIVFCLKLKVITPLYNQKKTLMLIILSLICCTFFTGYVLRYLPVLDFRPYKVGNNILELMETPEGAPKAIYEYKWKFELDSGEPQTIITQGAYPKVKGKLLGVETKMLEPGYKPPIQDFTMLKEAIDYTQTLLEQDSLVILVSLDYSQLQDETINNLKNIVAQIKSKRFQVIGLFSNDLKLEWLEVYACDRITLKTMIRSDPGFFRLEKGTIVEKQPWRKVYQMSILK